MLPISQFQNTIDYNTRATKRFKACRICRKHKLKCERKNNSTCQRCHHHALQCVYDVVGARRRDTSRRDGDLGSRGREVQQQETENPGSSFDQATQSVSRAQNATGSLESNKTSDAAAVSNSVASPISVPGQALESSPVLVNVGLHRCTPAGQTSDLTSDDLRAPVSALQNMSHFDGDSRECLTKSPRDSGHAVTQRPGPHAGSFFRKNTRRDDLLSAGILDQRQARHLFNLFMAGASNFLPIFDPVLDSFETLRARQPFCFTVILAVAACINKSPVQDQCLKEVKELVAENLFTYPPSLGDIQAMVILAAAYGECTWFALGHALQMALDLGLDKILTHEQSLGGEVTVSNTEHHRQVIRGARVWLALCFSEREIALGSGKSSRIPVVRAADLTHFTLQSDAHPTHMRLIALVEAVQIRDEFLAGAAATADLESTGVQQLRNMEARLDEWFQRWDRIHKDYGYDAASFQRTSLAGQRRYALMFLGCAIIGRLTGKRPLSSVIMSRSGNLSDMIDLILSIAIDQMRALSLSESYKWHLQWATNYTVMSLTFAGMFALEVSRYRVNSNQEEVFNTVSGVAQILADYHDPFFYQLLTVRLPRYPSTLSPVNVDQFNPGSDSQIATDFSPRLSAARHDPTDVADIHGQVQPQVNVAQGLLAPEIGLDDACRQNTLSQLLETPDWMVNPSSMLSFDLQNWQNEGAFAADC